MTVILKSIGHRSLDTGQTNFGSAPAWDKFEKNSEHATDIPTSLYRLAPDPGNTGGIIFPCCHAICSRRRMAYPEQRNQ